MLDCCSLGLSDAATFLLKKYGADVNTKSGKETTRLKLGDTPLHAAVRIGDIELVEELMEHGADALIENAVCVFSMFSILHTGW